MVETTNGHCLRSERDWCSLGENTVLRQVWHRTSTTRNCQEWNKLYLQGNSVTDSNLWWDAGFDRFCNGLWKTLWKSILENTKSFPKSKQVTQEICWRGQGGGPGREKSSFSFHSHALQQVVGTVFIQWIIPDS